MLRPLGSIFFILLFLAGPGKAALAAGTDRLTITTETGEHVFQVERAVTAGEREVGLMNRKTLPRDAGMIFRFDETQPVSMWMKNTLIPLDMVFVREDGTVAGVHENAVPLSEDIIPSPGPVRFVVELAGGVASEIHLRKGDKVSHPLIGD
jgi:uncharacterized membrane protein (UPF0127 family)